jgi:hypothetical protein
MLRAPNRRSIWCAEPVPIGVSWYGAAMGLAVEEVVQKAAAGVYIKNPELWPADALSHPLDPWQEEVMRKLFLGEKGKVSVRGGHGIGKTDMSATLAHYFLMNFIPSKVIVTGPCVEENEKILLADGRWEKIKDLSGRTFDVLSMDQHHSFSKQQAKAFPNGVKPVVRLTTHMGRQAIRTLNHPFRALRDTGFHWIPAGALKRGDFIGIPWNLSLTHPEKTRAEFEELVDVTCLNEQMTFGIEVPSHHTYVTDFLEHNTAGQTRKQFWSYLNTLWNTNVFKTSLEWMHTRMYVKGEANKEKWFATWVTSKEPKNLEGFHGPDEGRNLLWIVEEAKAVADPVYEALMGAISAEDNYVYISSTCGPSRGYFYDTHTKMSKSWDAMHIPSTLSPRVSMKQIDDWRDLYGGPESPIFKARVMAEFPDDDDTMICPLSWLEDALAA